VRASDPMSHRHFVIWHLSQIPPRLQGHLGNLHENCRLESCHASRICAVAFAQCLLSCRVALANPVSLEDGEEIPTMKKTLSVAVLAILVAACSGCQAWRWRHQAAPPPATYMMPAPVQEVITSPSYGAACTSCGPAAPSLCGPQVVMPGR
jgi:hypothetical protein